MMLGLYREMSYKIVDAFGLKEVVGCSSILPYKGMEIL